LQRKTLIYDKSGEEHFNLISALHKSVRSSDVGRRAVLAGRMLEGGEDRLYIARRLVRMAIEDIGMADPRALEQAMAAQQAVHFLGKPEGDQALAQLAIYLAIAPKSDAAYQALNKVTATIQNTTAEPVPMHLRNAPTRAMKQWGYGEGYQHAHQFEDALPDMSCLPEGLGDQVLFPTDRGVEKRIAERMAEIEEAKRDRGDSDPRLAQGRRARASAQGAAASDPAHTLWEPRPAPDWNEAYPIGNGRLGAMIFGGVETERLSLNEDTLYSDEPGHHELPLDITREFEEVVALLRRGKHVEAEEIMNVRWVGRSWPCYQPLGDLLIDFAAGDAVDYRRELRLDRAVATCGTARSRASTFASHPADVIAMRFAGKAPLTFRARFESPHPTCQSSSNSTTVLLPSAGQLPGFVLRRTLEWVEERKEQWKYPELVGEGRRRKPFAKQVLYGEEVGGRGMRFEARITVRIDEGRCSSDGSGIEVRDARDAELLLAVASSYNGFNKSPSRQGSDPAAKNQRTLARAVTRSFDQLRSEHIADHTALYSRSELVLPGASAESTTSRIESGDPTLAALYFHFGRYLMIAGSRPGTQPLNLQGLWNKDVIPPWASAYTVNINTEMNYWPAAVANLAECSEPLFRMLEELAVSGRKTAARMYGRRGWVAHHNTTIWRDAQPVDNNAMPSFWPMSAGWLSLHVWDQYRFTLDRAFLSRYYPLLRDASRFFADWLIDDGAGRLVTPAGHSPENRFYYRDPDTGERRTGGVVNGPAMDIAIVREVFRATLDAALVLRREEPLLAEIEQKLPKLLPYRIGARGNIEEWPGDPQEAEPQHRHVSHLFGLHPGTQILPLRDAALAAAAKRVLELRGDGGTGWSMAWKVNFWARLRDGDHALIE
jgi:alpha-L-fucosidase 2